jgi:hypothetical protein
MQVLLLLLLLRLLLLPHMRPHHLRLCTGWMGTKHTRQDRQVRTAH